MFPLFSPVVINKSTNENREEREEYGKNQRGNKVGKNFNPQLRRAEGLMLPVVFAGNIAVAEAELIED